MFNQATNLVTRQTSGNHELEGCLNLRDKSAMPLSIFAKARFLLLLGMLLPVLAQAQFSYTTNNGAITITKYTGSESEVIIPVTINGLPVTSIGAEAFKNSTNKLVSVIIGNSVTNIGGSAFYGCTNLTNITIGNNVAIIEGSALYGCTSLTNVTIPNSVTSIGIYAFSGCTSLASVTLGNSVTNIGMLAFVGCTSLANVTIPNSVTMIGASVFSGCTKLTNITVGNSVTNIENNAFSGCTSLTTITVGGNNPVFSSLDGVLFNKNQTTLIKCPAGKAGSYTIPNSVISIGIYAFSGCTSLASVTLGNSVTSIGDSAFSGCSKLTSVTIGNGVTSIGISAFRYCTSLTSVTIGNGVTSIGAFAFSSCPCLIKVYFQGDYPNIFGIGIFNSDTVITVYYMKGTTGWYSIFNEDRQTGTYNSDVILQFPCIAYTSVDGVYFNENQTEILQFPLDKAGSYTVPDSVTSIGTAFRGCTNLTDITLGKGITSIEDNAFESCTSLKSITIPSGVTSIGDGVFKSCFNLASVVFEGDIPSTYYDDLFSGANKVTVYYAPATSGWSPTFGGRPAVPKSLGQQSPLSIKIKTVQVSMQVKPTKKYQLQASLDMQTWTNVGVAFVATAAEEVQEFDTTSTGRFFRLYELQ